jgi:serine/threonine protein kinase
MIGQLLGGYRVLERVGEGPNGTVWKAEHPALKNLVAIKVLPADLAAKPSDRERFERGSRAAARLNHPGIATVFGAEFSGATPYIVSEFVDGETVNALSAKGPFSPRQAVDLVLQAARALQYAHQQGVIHRDISGGNVMVTRDGHCKIWTLALRSSATQRGRRPRARCWGPGHTWHRKRCATTR